MDYKIACLLLFIVTIVRAAHLPEVHEDSFSKSGEYLADVFNFKEYQKNAQHDLQKLRYQQQQVSDQQALNMRHARYLKDQDFAASEHVLITTKPRIVRKVLNEKYVNEDAVTTNKPSTYQVDEAADRQDYSYYLDPQLVRKSPKILQQNLGGFVAATQPPLDQIAVLNSLLEKAPNAQLHGLHQLLNSNQDHKPIKEELIDVPNTQNQPNIKVQSSGTPNSKLVQAQLDSASGPKPHKTLAAAQEYAYQHIRAQHAVNEQARAEAERVVLLQAQEQHTKKNEEAALKDKQRRIAQRKRIQEDRARIAAYKEDRLKYKNKPAQIAHAPSESHNYYTKQQPQATYDEDIDVSKYYNHPEFTAYEGKDEHGHHELQYAAKYAFGYRIRDIHHGNDFGHEETKDGESTKGHYHVLLPDGRVQNVQYYVDPTGYHADVSYDNIHHDSHE